MDIAITLDSAGRVVLPSEIRRRLNLRAGSRLRLAVVAERIELTPEPQADVEFVAAPSGRKVLPPSGKAVDAAAVVRDERARMARPRSRR